MMNLEIDNLYAFKDFKINFSYPKRLVNSPIKEEHLAGHPNFRYKKVNIVMGPNASGKTTLGEALLDIFTFIGESTPDTSITEFIADASKEAKFAVELVIGDIPHNAFEVTSKKNLARIECNIHPTTENSIKQEFEVLISYAEIRKNDSYESAKKRLREYEFLNNENYRERLKAIHGLSWLFSLTGDAERYGHTVEVNNNIHVFESVLKSLDSDIMAVEVLEGVENSFVIKKSLGNIIVQEGEVIKKHRLSSGTLAGIDVADTISEIKRNKIKFFYCDEKFTHIHSDLESAFIATMIQLLKSDTQLFVTTHNMELLNMDLPKHSFTFLRKNPMIEAIHPEDIIKKNDKSLYHAVKNDVFGTSPNTDMIFELLEDE